MGNEKDSNTKMVLPEPTHPARDPRSPWKDPRSPYRSSAHTEMERLNTYSVSMEPFYEHIESDEDSKTVKISYDE